MNRNFTRKVSDVSEKCKLGKGPLFSSWKRVTAIQRRVNIDARGNAVRKKIGDLVQNPRKLVPKQRKKVI